MEMPTDSTRTGPRAWHLWCYIYFITPPRTVLPLRRIGWSTTRRGTAGRPDADIDVTLAAFLVGVEPDGRPTGRDFDVSIDL
jgi:hypothetical protein